MCADETHSYSRCRRSRQMYAHTRTHAHRVFCVSHSHKARCTFRLFQLALSNVAFPAFKARIPMENWPASLRLFELCERTKPRYLPELYYPEQYAVTSTNGPLEAVKDNVPVRAIRRSLYTRRTILIFRADDKQADNKSRNKQGRELLIIYRAYPTSRRPSVSRAYPRKYVKRGVNQSEANSDRGSNVLTGVICDAGTRVEILPPSVNPAKFVEFGGAYRRAVVLP